MSTGWRIVLLYQYTDTILGNCQAHHAGCSELHTQGRKPTSASTDETFRPPRAKMTRGAAHEIADGLYQEAEQRQKSILSAAPVMRGGLNDSASGRRPVRDALRR